ncbi:MAG: GntR family transcriptional regulator [Porphyromonas sp.]|uniref:GntR family transcriptional regulator n=1 Tax=Porphyromonas sp. TaxID=1924944 RepID=UPI001A5FA337|nr:GntR family transcriptional regulator [Porphyromonas sp.]MBL6453599.1 GntR family transcriptional regulator [Porphyromonas sp.]
MITPRFNPQVVIYAQIEQRIKEKILSGEYPAGTQIPSVRQLAAELETNANTIFRAYENLQSEGLIYPRKGLGLFVSDTAEMLLRNEAYRELTEERLPELFAQLKVLNMDISEVVRRHADWMRRQGGAES